MTTLITVTEAAAALGVSRMAVLLAISRGTLSAVKLGTQWTLERAEVERYAAEHSGKVGKRAKPKD